MHYHPVKADVEHLEVTLHKSSVPVLHYLEYTKLTSNNQTLQILLKAKTGILCL